MYFTLRVLCFRSEPFYNDNTIAVWDMNMHIINILHLAV